jgi:Tfp pilus assembly protein PilF
MPPPTTFVLTPPQLTPSAASSNASLARPAQSLVTPKLRRGAEVIVQTRPSPLLGAYAALRAGDLTLAEKLYKETLSGEPDQPDAHLGLAVIAQSRGETAIAMGHYRSVIEATPHHPRAWAGIADLAGDAEIDAMESRLRGLIADRPAASLHFALGNLVMRRSRWAEAQESYFAAFTSVPDNADYAFNLAVALDRLGKGSAAQTYYEKALALARDGRPVQFDVKAAGVRLTSLSAEAR